MTEVSARGTDLAAAPTAVAVRDPADPGYSGEPPAPAYDRRGHLMIATAGSRLAASVARVYVVMGVALLCYLASLIIQGAHQWPIFNSWVVAGFEIVGSGLCILGGLTRPSGRLVPIVLGLSLLMWALGDLVLTIQTMDGVFPARPSWADACYLAYFPLAYVAVFAFLRAEMRRLATPSWLDSAVASAGAAAAVAAFAFNSLVRFGGGSTSKTLTVLAYPIGDLLLFSLVVGGSTVMSTRHRAPWLLLAGGIALNVVGDTSHAFSASLGHPGYVLASIDWPASILLMSIAVWVRPKPTQLLAPPRSNTYLIPGIAAVAALVILFVGNIRGLSWVAIGLATFTLALVGLRLVRSVRAMRALSQQRRDQSLTDELTGLRNRRYLTNVLDAYFAEIDAGITSRSLALLFIDLVRFKELNDTFGHLAGDQLLTQFGPRLSEKLRADDLLVRLGGDEFVVVLADAGPEYAANVAQRLTAALSTPFVLGAVQASLSANIGIAMAPADATDTTSLLWCADIAMYRAKLGGLPYANYRDDLDKAGNRIQLLDELQTAIHEHQLVLYYQPQLDLKTGEMLSAEALIRWVHPTLGVLSPAEFLPFAEDAGLMSQITRLVLADASEQCASWHRQGVPMTVSVNVSVPVLLEPGFPELVRDTLETHQLPASALVVEVTETSVISDFDRAQRAIKELSDLGVVVSIDDFGAGYTSLAHLSGLAVTELKLDRSFIVKLTGTHSQRDQDLVRATIDLGHTLGLRIVGEGIEDADTLDLLTELGCDFGQGYLICVPKPARHLTLGPVRS
jgi:diguanylate cyclase